MKEQPTSQPCESCGEPSDGWPGGKGGELCQMCWERESSEAFWRAMTGENPWPWVERAMKNLIQFLEDELETRKRSMLPDTDGEGAGYIEAAEKAVADVRHVRERLEELYAESIPIVLTREDAMRAGGIAELQALAERFGLIEGRA